MKRFRIHQHIIKSLQNYIRKFSIKKRLILLELVPIIIMILWSSVSINNSIVQTNTVVSTKNYEQMNTTMKSLDSSLQALNAVSRYPTFQSYNASNIYNYLSNKEYYKDQIYQYYEEVQQVCHSLYQQYNMVNMISICDNDGNGIFVKSMSNLYTTIQNQSAQKWLKQTMAGKGAALYWTSSDFSNSEYDLGKNQIYISRAIINVDHFNNVGFVLASANLNSLFDDFESAKFFTQQHIGIYNNKGQKIFGDITEDNIGGVLQKISKKDSSIKWRNGSSGEIRASDNLYSFSTIDPEYTCIISTPYACVVNYAGQSMKGLLVQWVALILFVLLGTSIMINSILHPISKLSAACQSVKQGNFSVKVMDGGNDEISDYARSFNSMTERLDTLITEGYKKDILATQLELQMLRNQINPHFLYNTLESIRAAASLSNQVQLGQMAALLGKTMRYGISSPSETVSVRTELESLNDYIELQKLRYQDKIQFIVCITDELLDLNIIKVVLQPLVENAIYHGVDNSPNNGIINILGFMRESSMIFQVIDNGDGIEENLLNRLNDYINGKNEAFKSIGLKNVNRRIQLFYGKEYGVTIQSVIHQGTIVTITLPNNIS